MREPIKAFLIALAVSSLFTLLMLSVGCKSKKFKQFDSDCMEACVSVNGGPKDAWKIIEDEEGYHCQCLRANK